MAPVLVCPECETKHPLDTIGPRSAFPCTGCGRTLKVPGAAIGAAVGAVAAGRPPDRASVDLVGAGARARRDELGPHRATSRSTPRRRSRRRCRSRRPRPRLRGRRSVSPTRPLVRLPFPIWSRTGSIRFALWIVAVPLAFLIVFTLARSFGLLSTNDVTDVALAEGWHRFMPIVRLLPFVALATAGLVHGGVSGITRLRESRRGGRTARRGREVGGRSEAGPGVAVAVSLRARARRQRFPGGARPRRRSRRGSASGAPAGSSGSRA